VTPAQAANFGRIVVNVVREYVTRRCDAIAHEMRSACMGLKDDLMAVRERVAVVEVKPLIPGPAGPPGRDGVDGIGFDDLAVEQVDETTVVVKAIRGAVVKEIGKVTFPFACVKGDYEPGQEYTPGNMIRHKSAIWLCRKATTIAPGSVTYDATGKPVGPQGKDFWTLWIADGKRGRDGKDGTPGPEGPPGADWQQVYDKTRRR